MRQIAGPAPAADPLSADQLKKAIPALVRAGIVVPEDTRFEDATSYLSTNLSGCNIGL